MSCCFQLKTVISTINLCQQKTTLFCFGSFVFKWPIVTNDPFLLFCLFFSDKTTVQWYFIVSPLFAVTVLAFVILYLWKRRIAGTYTSFNKFFCILNASSRWKKPNIMHHSDKKKQHNYILLSTFILKGEIRLLSLDSNDYVFILSWSTKINIIK